MPTAIIETAQVKGKDRIGITKAEKRLDRAQSVFLTKLDYLKVKREATKLGWEDGKEMHGIRKR